MGKLTVGMDAGSTNILARASDAKNKILARNKQKTAPGEPLEATSRSMYEAATAALSKAEASWEDVEHVGIAIPSSIDPDTGDLLHAPNLGWQDEPALPKLKEVFGREVFLENDVNCGTLGEFHLGAAKGTKHAVGLFVGTGLGGGVIINGKLHTGLRGVAGEIGHHIVKYNGRKCGCGNRGCLEAYASKTGFGRKFNKLINKKGKYSALEDEMGNKYKNVKSKALAKAYRAGDPVVVKVLQKGAYMLGVGTASIMAILAPECVVYGGGVMEAFGEELLPHIKRGMADHLFGIKPDDVKLAISTLGDDAVPLGAALLAQAKGNV